jgi:integrase
MADKKYKFRARNHLGREVKRVFTSKAAFEAFKKDFYERKELLKNKLELPPEKVTLADWLGKWVARRSLTHPRATFASDEQRARIHLLAYPLSNQILDSLTKDHWKEHFVTLRAQGYAPASVNRVRSLVSKLYNDAMADDPPKAQFNPVKLIKPLREANPDKLDSNVLPSVQDCLEYLREAKKESPQFFVFCAIALYTGMRKSEILALRIMDVELSKGFIVVRRILEQSSMTFKQRTKRGEAQFRFVGLHNDLRGLLRDYIAFHPMSGDKEALIVFESNRSCVEPTKINRLNDKVCSRLGRRVTPHGLRHTFATLFLSQGGSLTELSELLGHSSQEVTNRYKHLQPEFYRQQVNRISLEVVSTHDEEVSKHSKEYA